MLNRNIYLDFNATTPVHELVLEKMLPFFSTNFGNASSIHYAGWQASEAVEIARENMANAIEAEPAEIYFTSGATESINLAIRGVAEAYASKGKHIVSFTTEHRAVLDTLAALQLKGIEITLLEVDRNGLPDLKQLEEAIRIDTVLVTGMFANNETGVIFPIQQMVEITHQKGTLFFCDSTQAFGKIPVSVRDLKMDILAISAHKVYGPKGVGAIYLKRKNPRVSIIPQLTGGGHEKGKRSGTLNVPGIVGLGECAKLSSTFIELYQNHTLKLRDYFETGILKFKNITVNAEVANRLPNTTNFIVKNKKADLLLASIPQLACSTGSACSVALPEPSHVLKAMGIKDEDAFAAIRISLGITTTKEDIDLALELLKSKL
jgi:cysteine desulfurase